MLSKKTIYEMALRILNKMIKVKNDLVKVWIYKGIMLNKLGDWEEAIKALDKATELKPNSVKAWLHKGIILKKAAYLEEALKAFDKAIELEPDNEIAWLGKKFVLLELHRYKEVLEVLDVLSDLIPDDFITWHNKGIILLALGRYEEALEALDKATELKPDDKDIWIKKFLIYSKIGDERNASMCVDKITELEKQEHKSLKKKAISIVKGIMKLIIEIIKEIILTPVPRSKTLNEQVEKAMKMPTIKKFFSHMNPKEYIKYKKKLKEYIKLANHKTKTLRGFAKFVDTIDRILIIFAVMEIYTLIYTDYIGLGILLWLLKEFPESLIKFSYIIYYLIKTKEFRNAFLIVLFELLTMLPAPTFLLDLTNIYLRKAEKYAIKQGAKRFLKEMNKYNL